MAEGIPRHRRRDVEQPPTHHGIVAGPRESIAGHSFKQLPHLHPQPLRQVGDHHQRRVPLVPLDAPTLPAYALRTEHGVVIWGRLVRPLRQLARAG